MKKYFLNSVRVLHIEANKSVKKTMVSLDTSNVPRTTRRRVRLEEGLARRGTLTTRERGARQSATESARRDATRSSLCAAADSTRDDSRTPPRKGKGTTVDF